MVESQCEILWADNLGSGLGHHPTADNGVAAENPEKEAITTQQKLRYTMIGPWINISLTSDDKC